MTESNTQPTERFAGDPEPCRQHPTYDDVAHLQRQCWVLIHKLEDAETENTALRKQLGAWDGVPISQPSLGHEMR